MFFIKEFPGDSLECFSVFVSEDSSNNADVQELVLGEQILGTTLTSITLPDGSQAFIAENLQENGIEKKITF